MNWWLVFNFSVFWSTAISFFTGRAYAEWTPLIVAADFTGMRTDVMTTAGGIMSVVLIILGFAFIIKTFMNR